MDLAKHRILDRGEGATSTGAAFINSIGMPLGKYQTRLASAYLELETKIDRIIAREPDRRLAKLEVRLSKAERFEKRLEGVEAKYSIINKLERRITDLEHETNLVHDDICRMRASMLEERTTFDRSRSIWRR